MLHSRCIDLYTTFLLQLPSNSPSEDKDLFLVAGREGKAGEQEEGREEREKGKIYLHFSQESNETSYLMQRAAEAV